ncbi:uncharacterized protein PAC_13042 [Phialocephala subalpina]|uniref:Mid2 domain-containing protein n=1 Tax=Phialocephala subalpina TaxID=576137 RepID=A0A1L7XDN5_9HELO|nr:uncharacterized protein PAC_13042 [Phialocephala subalpina]
MTTSRSPELVNGILTSWIPFTTPGTANTAPCSTAMYVLEGRPDFIAVYDPWYGQHVNTALQCMAKEQTTWWDQTAAPATTFLLGPFACPTQFTTGTTSVINSETTLVGCCPSGYDFQGTIMSALSATQCLKTLTSGQVITPLTTAGVGYTTTTMTIGAAGYSLHGVQVNGYIFADAVATGSSSTSTSPTGSSPSSTNSGTSSPSSSASSSELSIGAKAGIGIGVALGVIGICCLIGALLILRRRSARTPEKGNFEPVPIYSPGYQGAPGLENTWKPPEEMAAARYVSEMPGQTQSIPHFIEIGT